MITYNDFIRIKRQEQDDSRMLSKLNDDTINDMKEFIGITKAAIENARNNNDEQKLDLLTTQLKNALSAFESIINSRMIKIANILIVNGNSDLINKENLSSKELVFVDELSKLFNNYKMSLLTDIKSVKPEDVVKNTPAQEQSKDDNLTVIKITADVPKFIWKNSKSYGPFSFPQVIEIDKDIADILIKSGKAINV